MNLIPAPELVYDCNLALLPDAARNLLTITWPSFTQENEGVLAEPMQKLLAYLRDEGVKYLLIDVRGSQITITGEAYSRFVAWFQAELLTTCLEKVARVTSSDAAREYRLLTSAVYAHERNCPIAFQDFGSEREAYGWLTLP